MMMSGLAVPHEGALSGLSGLNGTLVGMSAGCAGIRPPSICRTAVNSQLKVAVNARVRRIVTEAGRDAVWTAVCDVELKIQEPRIAGVEEAQAAPGSTVILGTLTH